MDVIETTTATSAFEIHVCRQHAVCGYESITCTIISTAQQPCPSDAIPTVTHNLWCHEGDVGKLFPRATKSHILQATCVSPQSPQR